MPYQFVYRNRQVAKQINADTATRTVLKGLALKRLRQQCCDLVVDRLGVGCCLCLAVGFFTMQQVAWLAQSLLAALARQADERLVHKHNAWPTRLWRPGLGDHHKIIDHRKPLRQLDAPTQHQDGDVDRQSQHPQHTANARPSTHITANVGQA